MARQRKRSKRSNLWPRTLAAMRRLVKAGKVARDRRGRIVGLK